MHFYRLSNEILASEMAMPELLPARREFPSVRFAINTDGVSCLDPPEWLRQVTTPEGNLWAQIGRVGSAGRAEIGYLLRYPGYADFLVDSSAAEITCHPVPGVPHETIRHLLLDQVFPLVLCHRGAATLHASSVANEQGAIAILGASGSGKSTLAASLCSLGCAFIADDCLLLMQRESGFDAVLNYPSLRLWESSAVLVAPRGETLAHVAHYSDKKRIPAQQIGVKLATHPIPLRKIFVLNPQADYRRGVTSDRLSWRMAVMELVASCYCLDPTDRVRNQQNFDRLARLAESVSVIRLTYTSDIARLGELREAVHSAPDRA